MPSIPMKCVVYNAEYYHRLLYDIPSTFTTLTAIIISHSNFQYELFQYLLDNIDCLEDFELSDSNLIHCAQNPELAPINWPDSLKNLKICNNCIAIVENRQNDIILANDHVFNSPTDQLYFSLRCLPKLILFEYQLFLRFDDDNLLKFLKLNPQITNLIISVPDFNLRLFEAIQCIDKLSNLRLKFSSASALDVCYNKLPILNNINCLTIDCYERPDFGDILSKKFTNLAELKVIILSSEFDTSIPQIEKVSSVKSLILNIDIVSYSDIKFIFPKIDNLKSVEFISDSDFDLFSFNWNVDSFPNLKSVKFSGFNQYYYEDKLKANPELVNSREIVSFPHSITYYRVSY